MQQQSNEPRVQYLPVSRSQCLHGFSLSYLAVTNCSWVEGRYLCGLSCLRGIEIKRALRSAVNTSQSASVVECRLGYVVVLVTESVLVWGSSFSCKPSHLWVFGGLTLSFKELFQLDGSVTKTYLQNKTWTKPQKHQLSELSATVGTSTTIKTTKRGRTLT